MRHHVRSAPRWIVCPALLLALGCGNRSTLERSTRQGEDAEGDRTSSTSSTLTFHGSEAEARLSQAKARARDGAFGDAIRGFQALYQDLGNPEPVRAEALLRWAEAEGNLLNPQRDLEAAVGRLKLFEEQFPRSELRGEARESLARMRTLQDSSRPGGGQTPAAGGGRP